MTLQQYEATENSAKSGEATVVYVLGVIKGFEWSNAEDRVKGREPLYCSPNNLAITPDQDFDILNRFIKARNFPVSTPIEGIALTAMENTFPCP